MHKYRFLRDRLPTADNRRLVVLTGARQTGKTTLTGKVYADLNYISLDAPENREMLKNVTSANWSRVVGRSVLDEAQKEPQVFEKVKYAFDNGDIQFTVLTGSSQIMLLKNIRETLAGRAFFYELWPLMQSELSRADRAGKASPPLIHYLLEADDPGRIFADLPPVRLDKDDIDSRNAENHVLTWGGMPALLPLNEADRWKWLKDYTYAYLERDLADLVRFNDLSAFWKFQRLAALRSAGLLNYSELGRDAGISVDTARRYLEYLRISYQAFLVQPFYKNLTSSLVKTPKLYWTDIGIWRVLSGFTGGLTGELYETMVVSEIMKWIRTAEVNVRPFFYRTRSGLELDLLIETGQGYLGLEIKSRSTVVVGDTRAMKAVAAALGDQWLGGMVVYTGDEIGPIGRPNLWKIPSRRLFQPPLAE